MAGLRILLTNTALRVRAGSELYVRDLATALLARGHLPIVYSPQLGEMAAEVRAAAIPVTDDLSTIANAPDVIHGQHHLETMTALLHFPDVPAISVCHGWLPWEEAPPRFPRIKYYVAVDEPCRDRLGCEHGIPEARVRLLLNFVDLERFQPRPPLPPRPRRALVFSNGASDATHLPGVREGCARAGIEVDVVGLASGRPSAAPEELLGRYDVVFAKARAALEALAVGAAVVLCDTAGLGPMVTSGDLDRLRGLNLGIRTLREPVTADAIGRALASYDPTDAAAVAARIRATAGRDAVVDALLALYREAIAEHRAAPATGRAAEGPAAAAYLRWLGPFVKQSVARVRAERDRLRTERTRLQDEIDAIRSERDEARAAREHVRAQAAAIAGERDRLVTDLDVLRGTATVRLRERVLASPGLGGLVRTTVRLVKGAPGRGRP